MNKKLVECIVDYAHKIYDENLYGDKTNNISVKLDDKTMYITKSGVNFKDLTDKDIIVLDLAKVEDCPQNTKNEALMHRDIYKNRTDVQAIMVTSPIYALTCANKKISIPPVLDDMAQIVGPTAKTAKSNNVSAIIKALKGRSSCMLSGIGSLSTGKTLNEAYTASMVLDKAAHTLIMATAVGGCKPISKFVAVIEHIVYRKKYSKANQEALLAAERD